MWMTTSIRVGEKKCIHHEECHSKAPEWNIKSKQCRGSMMRMEEMYVKINANGKEANFLKGKSVREHLSRDPLNRNDVLVQCVKRVCLPFDL